MASKDPFSIDIVLRHPKYTPQRISDSPALKPIGSWSVGQKIINKPAKWTYFYARLQQGDYRSEFSAALKKVVQFIEKNSAFWSDFVHADGEVELILNHRMSPQEQEGDQIFDLYLTPEFLGKLSNRRIGLMLRGWQGRVRRRTSATRPVIGKRRSPDGRL